MSKIKTNRLEPRATNGSLTIGNPTSYTTFEGDVQIPNYATKEYVLNHLLNDGFHTEDIVMKEEAGKPGGYARLTYADIPQVDWYDMKNTIRDNHYDYRINMSHSSIDSSIQSLKEDVITLEGEIESLITLDEKGSWVSTSNDPPESGKVQFSNTNFNTSPMTVKISKLDTDGTSHTFVTAGLGTWIEFVEDDQDYCLGQITAIDNDDDAFFLATFDVSVAKGDVHANSVVKIRLFEAAATEFFAPVSLNCGSGARWQKGNLNESTLEGYRYFGIEVAGSSSSSIGLGNVLYLNKLVDSEGVLQRMDQYTPTDNSYCEVYSGNELYFKSQLKPSTYKVADRNPNHIVCDFSTNYPLVSKSGGNWSGSSTYHLILTGMKINN